MRRVLGARPYGQASRHASSERCLISVEKPSGFVAGHTVGSSDESPYSTWNTALFAA